MIVGTQMMMMMMILLHYSVFSKKEKKPAQELRQDQANEVIDLC